MEESEALDQIRMVAAAHQLLRARTHVSGGRARSQSRRREAEDERRRMRGRGCESRSTGVAERAAAYGFPREGANDARPVHTAHILGEFAGRLATVRAEAARDVHTR